MFTFKLACRKSAVQQLNVISYYNVLLYYVSMRKKNTYIYIQNKYVLIIWKKSTVIVHLIKITYTTWSKCFVDYQNIKSFMYVL